MNLSKAIDGFCMDIEHDGYSPYTIEYYRGNLLRWSRYMHNPDVVDITTASIKEYLHSLRSSGLAGSSVYTHWKCIRSFFNFASTVLQVERPDDIPAPKYSERDIIPFTQDEIQRLLKATEKSQFEYMDGRRAVMPHRNTARDKAMMLLLLDTGMRIGEFVRLQYRDLDMDAGYVEVIPFMSGKKSKPRTLYIGKSTKRALWLYLAQRDDIKQTDSLFVTDEGKSFDRHSAAKVLKRAGSIAGVRRCHPHRFRHTFAIQYLRNGGDIFTLKTMLGHASWKMVRRYLDIAMADVEIAHRRASPVDRWNL